MIIKFNKFIIPYFLFVVIYLVAKTLRVKSIDREIESKLEKQGKAIIYVFWHGRMLYFPYLYRFLNKYSILTSPSGDGKIVAKTSSLFGFSIIRGSSYKKGGVALLRLVRTVKKGRSVGIIGDGSRGPFQKAQKGIIDLAYLTGAPILPIVYSAKNKIEFNSWDKFILPFPFSKIKVVYGDPIYVEKNAEEKELETKLKELQSKLDIITDKADNWGHN